MEVAEQVQLIKCVQSYNTGKMDMKVTEQVGHTIHN